jgi:thioredoxin 2
MSSSIVECTKCGAKNRVRPSPSGTPSCAKCHAKLPWEVEAGAGEFDAELNASVPVLADFWAPWCAPCRMIAPVLERLAQEQSGSLKVVRVNIDENPSLASRYRIQSIPSLVLFKGGDEADRAVGALPPPQLEAWIAPHLASQGISTSP